MHPNKPKAWEKQIQEAYQKQQHAWDEEAVWQSIEQALPEKRKRRFFIWFILGLILVGMGSTWAYHSFIDLPAEKQEPSTTIARSVTKYSLEEKVTIEKSSADLSRKIMDQSISQEVSLYAQEIPTMPTIINVQPLPQAPVLLKDLYSKIDQRLPQLAAHKGSTLNTIPSKSDSLTWNKPSIDLLEISTKIAPSKTWHFTFYSTVGSSARQINPLQTQAQASISAREAGETSLEALGFGLSLTFIYNKRWSIQAGLEWQQITEQLDWATRSFEQTFVESDQAYFYDPPGQSRQFIAGQVPVNTTTFTQVLHYNRYQYIDLPILIGYQKNWNQLHWRLQTGPVINISQSVEGRFLKATQQFGNFDELAFRPSTGLAWQIGTQ
ncbi:MAG: hypothetical protein AAF242_04260, partial [Bacteroidota bacterium]